MRVPPLHAMCCLLAGLAIAGLAACGGDDGSADAGTGLRSGQSVSPAQARQLAAARGDGGAIELEVGCCSADEVDTAVGIAWGLQAAHDLPADTPVLVRGPDLRLASAAANRLADGGLTHVWLVTP